MVDAVEELREVQVDHPPVTRRHVLPSAEHRAMSTAARTEAEAVVREGRVEDGRQHLQQGLLNRPVQHRRDTEHPHTLPVRLRDLDPKHRLGTVAAAEQLLPDPRPVLAAVRHQLVHGHPVDARCPAVPHHTLVGCQDVLTAQRFLHEQ